MELGVGFELVSEKDISDVVQLANVIWRQHYTPILGEKQVQYMLDMFLTKDVIKSQIDTKGYCYYLIKLNEEQAGFMAFYPNEGMFLSKLYILAEHRGKGISKKAIGFLRDICKERGYYRIWLQVDRKNQSSINAYYALGFKKIFERVTEIGNGFLMDDYFLELII